MKFAAAEVLGGTAMGGRGKTSAGKIRDGAGEAISSLSEESTSTTKAQGKRDWGVLGGSDDEDPKMAREG